MEIVLVLGFLFSFLFLAVMYRLDRYEDRIVDDEIKGKHRVGEID